MGIRSLLLFSVVIGSSQTVNGLKSPPKVTGVQIIQYNPLISDRTKRNALILWNEIQSATQYVISVLDYSTGMNIDLAQPQLDTRPSYRVLKVESNIGLPPKLPLVIGTKYGVEVKARNHHGDGPASDTVNFTLSATSMNYPMHILSVEPEAMIYYGHRTNINQLLRVGANSGPIVVDTIQRRAYWYDQNMNYVATQSLGIGGAYKVLFDIPVDQILGSLTYDWIAKELYITYISRSSRKLSLFKREIYNADIEEKVVPEPFLQVSLEALINSEINPILGYFYYSITDQGITTIYILKLRTSEYEEPSPVNIPIHVTPALALNPLNNNLLVSERSIGNIHQCSFDFSSCSVYINRSVIEANSRTRESGLPAGIIKYGGEFIYWSSINNNAPGISAVNVSDTSTRTVLSNNATKFMASLSPDTQPTPSVECLSPNIFIPSNKQLLSLDFKTSNTLQLVWRNSPTLQSTCGQQPFSVAPFVFNITVEINQSVIYNAMTRRRIHLVQGLDQNTTYVVFVSSVNEYSLTFGQSSSSIVKLYQTGEEAITCDNPSKSFQLHYGDQELLLRLNYNNKDLLRTAAKSGECVNITVEHESQTVLVQDRVRVFLNCDILKQNENTVIEWLREPINEFNGSIHGRPQPVRNSMEVQINKDVLIIPETHINNVMRSNRFTCRATTNDVVQFRRTTVFFVGEQPFIPATGGCNETNGTMRCIIGKQSTKLTLRNRLKSISLECPILNFNRTSNVSIVHPAPVTTWSKDGVDIIHNGMFTNDISRVYPEFSESLFPVLSLQSNRITILLKPSIMATSQLFSTRCLHHEFDANLEETYYHLAAGEWTCSVRNPYGEEFARILVSERDLCATEDQCGGFTCQSIAKKTCCDCPMNSNYLSHQLGKQCTKITCPQTSGNQQNIKVSLNQNGEIIGTYTCEMGYTLVGKPNRTCQQTQQTWTGQMPFCKGGHASKQAGNILAIFILCCLCLIIDCTHSS